MNAIDTNFIKKLVSGDFKTVARALSIVENEGSNYQQLLTSINPLAKPVIGITGPPGAGKSTLVNALTSYFANTGKRIAILAVDPTSPFNYGALLGDRIRMAPQFNNPLVFIRSLATRGALGGISAKTIEMLDVLKASNFDVIIIETVGVGQSEVEIAGIADTTAVVLVPESGDEIQHIKSGLMEVAQIFVVNKADRAGADGFANNIKKLMRQQHQQIPVFKTVADKNEGIEALAKQLLLSTKNIGTHKELLMTEKALKLILNNKMKAVNKSKLHADIQHALTLANFNIYQFVENWIKNS